MEMLVAGAALKVAVTELKNGFKGLIKNYVEFESVLDEIASTLDAIESVLISKFEDQNAYLNPPVQRKVQEKLLKEIENGQKLVKECSEEAGTSLLGCLKKTMMYTKRLRKLDESLRKQLQILMAQEVLIGGQLVHLIAEKLEVSIPQDRHKKYQSCQVLDQIQVEDASPPVQMDIQKHVPSVRKDVLFLSIGRTLFAGFAGAAISFHPIGSVMNMVVDSIEEVIMYKRRVIPLLKSVVSNLDSARSVFRQIAQLNEELDLKKEEVEDVMQQIDEGIVLLSKLSKVQVWNTSKMYNYGNELLDWEQYLQRQLCILHVQGVRDVNECLVSIRKTKKVVTEVEMPNTNLGEGLEQIATITDLLEKIIKSQFRREAKGIREPLMKNSFISNESRLRYIISTLDILKPLIQKITKISEEMDFPKEGAVQECHELIHKLCKAREWNIFRKHRYMNTLIGWEQTLQRQLDILIVQGIRNVKKYLVSMRKTSEVVCGSETSSTSQVEEEVSVPIEIASPLKIPNLRTIFPPRLGQPQNKKKRVKPLAHKTLISSSDEPAHLPLGHNASTHSPHKSSPNSAIVPVDQEQYGKEESSHLYRVGMQDMYLSMQRFHVIATRLLQSEERIKLLETNYQNAEESWKLENRKLSERLNIAMAQVDSLTKEKDSLAEKVRLLEKNEVTASQEAQEILTTEWVSDFRRQMQKAEEEWFTLGCRVGFKSFLAKVGNKYPKIDLSDIGQFEPIKFDMKVIEDVLGPDYDNEAENDSDDDGTNHSDEEDGSTDEEGGGETAAEVPGDALERIHNFAEHYMTDGITITVNMEKEVLGLAEPMHIFQEDVIEFKEMKPISATCINVYMWHLYDVLKQSNTDGIFRFCDASSISVGTPEEKAEVLATRLQQLSTKKILLVPYNSGYHWTLTIINEERNRCYYMDPLHSGKYPVGWKSVVNNGIKKYNEKRGGGHQKIPRWKTLKGPKQPSNVECGYYVMRYMKEIVEDKSISFAKKWGPKKSLSAYTERAVDEVCLEWASLVYRVCQSWAAENEI